VPTLSEKQKLLRKLTACGFALTEANLYLDSHPDCQMGLEYFRKHKAEYEALEAEYTEKYGPLTARQSTAESHWDWVSQPFPWERSES
jgi:spore coat protein JB